MGARMQGSRIGRDPCCAVFRQELPGLAHAAALVTLPAGFDERVAARAAELRLGDGAAELVRGQLAGIEQRNSDRRLAASHYSSELSRYDAFRVPRTPDERLPTYAAYVLRITQYARTSADDLHKLLYEAGIETRRMTVPLGEREICDAPVAEQIRSNSLLLPTEGLDEDQRNHVLEAIFDYAIG
jgi:dTDP-4-amino-4,6-dideoxygalactose transaminase